jgi:hypothetical protein
MAHGITARMKDMYVYAVLRNPPACLTGVSGIQEEKIFFTSFFIPGNANGS